MLIELLFVIAIYGVYKIAREIMGNNKHLSDAEIKEYKYKRRSLSESAQRRITNHIGTCDECRERFTSIMNS